MCESFQLSKDAGFKVIAHMMPDLPNVDIERDVNQFIVSYNCIRKTFLIHLFIFYQRNCVYFRNSLKTLLSEQMV